MKPRNPRSDECLEFSVSTFGSREIYTLFSLNISYSGALLSGFQTVPFNKNSLLEITIDPNLTKVSGPIWCQAKIARIVKGNSKGLAKYKGLLGEDPKIMSILGVHFTEFESSAAEGSWHEYVKILL